MKPNIRYLGILITLITLEVLGEKTCRDCIVYTSCPKAAFLANISNDANTSAKFHNAFCGYDEQQKYKVCCSEFDDINVDFRTDEDNEEPADLKHKTESVENHPNKVLLPSECGDINGDRVVGGDIAAMYEFPWMALLSYRTRDGYKFQCGGTIINSRYVLTAAHCVVGKTVAGVRVGEYNTFTKIDCSGKDDLYFCESHLQDFAVESIASHENYTTRPIIINDIALIRVDGDIDFSYKSIASHENYTTRPIIINDIALIRVDGDIDFSYKNIEAICLPVSSDLRNKKLPGTTGVVTGWGDTEFGIKSSVLRKVEVPITSEKICRNYHMRNQVNQNIPNSIFCAGEIDKDSCGGDSGGPLQIEEMYDGVHRYVQYGIVSYGPKQCGSQSPGLYTDVSKHMGWILDNIRK